MKDIVGYEGLYTIDDNLNVWSSRRAGTEGKYINVHPTRAGYLAIRLWKDGKRHHRFLHRVIAQIFIPNPKNLSYINHKNGIKTDNRVDNLEWCSMAENNQHAYNLGLNRGPLGTKRKK